MRTRRTIRKGRAGLIPKATRPTLQENRQLHSQTAFAVGRWERLRTLFHVLAPGEDPRGAAPFRFPT